MVAFGKVADSVLIDAVPLEEISNIYAIQDSNLLSNITSSGSDKSPVVENGSITQQPKGALSRIKSVSLLPGKSTTTEPEAIESAKDSTGKGSIIAPNTITIVTDQNGYNSGRKYYVEAAEADRREIISTLLSRARVAKKEKEAKGRMQRAREKVARLTGSKPFQYFFAILIVFVSDALQVVACTAHTSSARRPGAAHKSHRLKLAISAA